MAKLYFNQLSRSGGLYYFSQDAAYPASNALLQSIDRQYRSANLVFPTSFEYLGFDLASIKKISAFYIHDHNCETEYANGADATALGGNGVYLTYTPTKGAEQNGRRRSLFKTGGVYVRSVAVTTSLNNSGSTVAEMTFTCAAQGPSSSKYTYWKIRGSSYTIASGDVLRYDVWIDPSNPADVSSQGAGAVEINLTTTPFIGRGYPLVDGGGDPINRRPAGSRGVWISRAISLTAAAGKVISSVDLVNENSTVGTYVCKYRNMRITDASGSTEKLVIWKGGVPEFNADDYTLQFYGHTITTQGSPTDGLPYWRIGAVYAMQDVVTLPPGPEWEYKVRHCDPKERTKLPNGISTSAVAGLEYDEIEFTVKRRNLEDWGPVLRALKTGVCGLDMEQSGDRASQMWPVTMLSDEIESVFENLAQETFTFRMVEVV